MAGRMRVVGACVVTVNLLCSLTAWAADTTPPTAPAQPKEGSSTTDYDYDADGAYTVYWAAASDAESGISAYEVQERIGTAGTWTTLTSSRTSPNFSVSGRLDKTRYFYQVRAKNGAGLWGPWSPVSDGLLVDKTAPAAVTVTDDGATTTVVTQLHAIWTPSSDPDSTITRYEYLIRQDSISGPILVNWTSVGLSTSVTRTGLTLIHSVLYYLGVRALNGASLYSPISYSDGIQASRPLDSTPPTTPGPPTEGSSTDLDYDGDGQYPIYWPAASDAESGISAYELQERVGSAGTWTTLTNTTTARSFSVSSRLDKTRYVYQVRARNGYGTWGSFSPVSDGILIDKTAPATVTVTDDGATTASTTQLHARWTASSDAESGISLYQYLIRQDSTSGTILVNYTSVGLATEVTKTSLTLVNGKTYYIGVRALNAASLYSSVSYSDGIRVAVDVTPPEITITWPPDGAVLGAQ